MDPTALTLLEPFLLALELGWPSCCFLDENERLDVQRRICPMGEIVIEVSELEDDV